MTRLILAVLLLLVPAVARPAAAARLGPGEPLTYALAAGLVEDELCARGETGRLEVEIASPPPRGPGGPLPFAPPRGRGGGGVGRAGGAGRPGGRAPPPPLPPPHPPGRARRGAAGRPPGPAAGGPLPRPPRRAARQRR